MKTPLNNWFEDNIFENNTLENRLKYSSEYFKQFEFIKNVFPAALNINGFKERENYTENCVNIIETHMSKSIILPVYQINWKGIEFIIRHNFHDWKVSVKSDRVILGLTQFKLFDSKKKIRYYECEEFKKEWVYNCYDDCKSKFTCELQSRFDLYCLVKIIFNTYNRSTNIEETKPEKTFFQEVNERVTKNNNSHFGADQLTIINREWIKAVCELIDEDRAWHIK